MFVIGVLITAPGQKAGMLAVIFALFGLGWWIAAVVAAAAIKILAKDVRRDSG